MTNFIQKSIVKTADLVIFCNLWRLRNNQVLWTNQKSFTEKWHNVMTCLVMVFSYVANYSRNVFKSALNQSTLILIIFILEVHLEQKYFHIAICRFFLVSGIAKNALIPSMGNHKIKHFACERELLDKESQL